MPSLSEKQEVPQSYQTMHRHLKPLNRSCSLPDLRKVHQGAQDEEPICYNTRFTRFAEIRELTANKLFLKVKEDDSYKIRP